MVTTFFTLKPCLLAVFDRVFSWEVHILTFAYCMPSPLSPTADLLLMADKMHTHAQRIMLHNGIFFKKKAA